MLRVHSYESLGTMDGPGIRYVVFLQGCPFRCQYCANPDTIDPVGESKLTDWRTIVEQVESMKPFFGRKGGVTFSGGEPTMQAEALLPLFLALHEKQIHICLDTNGGIWNKHVEQLLELTDLVLLDVKQMDPSRHLALTGRSNRQTLSTAAWLEARQRPFWLRYVLVPSISDDEKDLRALGNHFRDYQMLQRLEILPYHNLGVHKYEALGWEYQLKNTPSNTLEKIDRAESILKEYISCVVVN